MISLILQVYSNSQPPQSSGVLNHIGLRLINKIRIERVQDITVDDCFAEGIHIESPGAFNPERPDNWNKLSEAKKNEYAESAARAAYIAGIDFVNNLIDRFGERWNERYGKRKGFQFSDNPWVQVIEFSRIR
jgi:hypothetical protein